MFVNYIRNTVFTSDIEVHFNVPFFLSVNTKMTEDDGIWFWMVNQHYTQTSFHTEYTSQTVSHLSLNNEETVNYFIERP